MGKTMQSFSTRAPRKKEGEMLHVLLPSNQPAESDLWLHAPRVLSPVVSLAPHQQKHYELLAAARHETGRDKTCREFFFLTNRKAGSGSVMPSVQTDN